MSGVLGSAIRLPKLLDNAQLSKDGTRHQRAEVAGERRAPESGEGGRFGWDDTGAYAGTSGGPRGVPTPARINEENDYVES